MTSVRYRDKLSVGRWTLEIRDVAPSRSGSVGTPTLTFFGTPAPDDNSLGTPPITAAAQCATLRQTYRGLQCCNRTG